MLLLLTLAAILVGMVSYVGLTSVRRIQEEFDRSVNQDARRVVALLQTGDAVAQLSAQAREIELIGENGAEIEGTAAAEKRFQLLAAVEQIRIWREQYRRHLREIDPKRSAFLQDLDGMTAGIVNEALVLTELKAQKRPQHEVVAESRKLSAARQELARLIDNAIAEELSDLEARNRQANVMVARAIRTGLPLLMTAVLLALLIGALVNIRLARDADRMKGLADRVQQQLQRLSILHTIDTAILTSLDLRVTLDLLLEQATDHLGVHAADVLLLNPSTQTLDYAAGRGFQTAALQHTRLRLGEGHAGRAALERRTINIPDLTETPGAFVRAPLLPGEDFTAYYGVPLIAKGQVKGVLEIFHRTPLDPDDEWLRFLEAMGGQAAIAIDSAVLFEDLHRANVDLTLAYDTTLEGWSRALDLRDKETEGHTQRVTELTMRLARAMGMSEARLVHVRRGALLHDIGKMGIPDSILLKPGPLTADEWEIMRRHPVYAYEMLWPIAYLRPALDIPYCHHEKWDGTGYPRGLKGEHIPLAARIFAVADVWDALSSDRPYRSAMPRDAVRAYISEQAHRHFDPTVVETFWGVERADLAPSETVKRVS